MKISSFGNYDYEEVKAEIRKRLLTRLGRTEWMVGKPFDSDKVIELQKRKISRKQKHFESELARTGN
jgi:hypothetical protein